MNRLPFISTVAAVVALTASVAYWGLQLYKPAQRPIAAVPVTETPPAPIDAARGLFGGDTAVAAVSNYELRGVVAARNGQRSVAIIAANGEPPKAYPVGTELAPGITVKDVQPRFVTLSEGGVQKRLDLPADMGMSSTTAAPLPEVKRGGAPAPAPQPASTAPPAPPAASGGQAAPSGQSAYTGQAGQPGGQAAGQAGGQAAPVQTAPAQRTSTDTK
jgi:general secretion pathway protein C